MLSALSTRSSQLCRLLVAAALPLACAVGVEPDEAPGQQAGAGAGGSMAEGPGGASGSASLPTAGKSSSGGSGVSPFGGTSSTAGKPSGGGSGAGSGGGSAAGSGSGGSAAGAGGSAAGAGGGGAGCACPKTLPWVDNTVMSWASGDCVSTAGTTYLYTGTKAQTYANAQCNPAKQETWCADMGNDYKFMACP